jgi:aminotransferase
MATTSDRALIRAADIDPRPRFRAHRTTSIVESVIREMSRLADQHGAVNLAQGFPDFPAPGVVKEAAAQAIAADVNQYAITWGAKPLRNAIAAKYRRHYALDIDPEREITVCCGSTEGMMAALLALSNPGEEIIIFEPYYENFGPDTLLCGAERRFVRLYPPDWRFDPEELRRAFSPRTKAIIINSPGNPTGQVFDRAQLEFIASLCQEFDALAITDEIYEHIVYDGAAHVPMMSIPGMRDRTVLINSMSKTYAVTGWRVGWVLASPDLSDSIRKVHDFLTVGAAAPLQEAGAVALSLPDDYYAALARDYQGRRDVMMAALDHAGFRASMPRGAYYVMADISAFGFADDVQFARHLMEGVGVATVPGSSFFQKPEDGSQLVRFCFCKKYETLKLAEDRLSKI